MKNLALVLLASSTFAFAAQSAKTSTTKRSKKIEQQAQRDEKSVAAFDAAIAAFDTAQLDDFFQKTDKRSVRAILNESSVDRGPGFVELISIAYQMEEEEGLALIQKALDNGANVTKSFKMGTEEEARNESPFSVAVLFAYLTGNTRIVEMLCEHGATSKMKTEEVDSVIDGWYNEMKKSFNGQFEDQEEADAELVDTEEIKRSVLTQFDVVRDALRTIVEAIA